MRTVRRAADRGQTKIAWLDSRHSFSFGGYHDPEHMSFRTLRVINDDYIAGGGGFPTHGHRDMEIITYVLEGGISHRDSTGGEETISAGEIQVMTAGSGIMHSEFNASSKDTAHMLQIWITPAVTGLPPGYRQQRFPITEERNQLHLIAAPAGHEGDALPINQNARLYAGRFDAGGSAAVDLQARHAWLQVARGTITVGDEELHEGDALAISGEDQLAFTASADSEVLVFDL